MKIPGEQLDSMRVRPDRLCAVKIISWFLMAKHNAILISSSYPSGTIGGKRRKRGHSPPPRHSRVFPLVTPPPLGHLKSSRGPLHPVGQETENAQRCGEVPAASQPDFSRPELSDVVLSTSSGHVGRGQLCALSGAGGPDRAEQLLVQSPKSINKEDASGVMEPRLSPSQVTPRLSPYTFFPSVVLSALRADCMSTPRLQSTQMQTLPCLCL